MPYFTGRRCPQTTTRFTSPKLGRRFPASSGFSPRRHQVEFGTGLAVECTIMCSRGPKPGQIVCAERSKGADEGYESLTARYQCSRLRARRDGRDGLHACDHAALKYATTVSSVGARVVVFAGKYNIAGTLVIPAFVELCLEDGAWLHRHSGGSTEPMVRLGCRGGAGGRTRWMVVLKERR